MTQASSPRKRGTIRRELAVATMWQILSPTIEAGGHGSRRSPGRREKVTLRLPVLVHRLALLDECRHAFGAVFQREGGMKQVALDIDAFGQRRLECAVD